VHYALRADEWGNHSFQTGRVAVMGNVLKLGPDSATELPLVLIEGDGPVELYEADNLVLDKSGRVVEPPELVHDPSGHWRRIAEISWPDHLVPRPASETLEWVLREAGARPWDRDATDKRIVRNVRVGEGRIIDSEEQVGGYPRPSPTRRLFNGAEWDFR
ncbi:MAG: pectate lyase, partial [Planctomycetota bacterium]|nr:pectate lyase [Planctomycetota bacterium]